MGSVLELVEMVMTSASLVAAGGGDSRSAGASAALRRPLRRRRRPSFGRPAVTSEVSDGDDVADALGLSTNALGVLVPNTFFDLRERDFGVPCDDVCKPALLVVLSLPVFVVSSASTASSRDVFVFDFFFDLLERDFDGDCALMRAPVTDPRLKSTCLPLIDAGAAGETSVVAGFFAVRSRSAGARATRTGVGDGDRDRTASA